MPITPQPAPTFLSVMDQALSEPQSWLFPLTPTGRSQAMQVRYRFYNIRRQLRRRQGGVSDYDLLEFTIQEQFQPPGYRLTIGPAGSGVIHYLKAAQAMTPGETFAQLGNTMTKGAIDQPDNDFTPHENAILFDVALTLSLEMFLDGTYDWAKITSDGDLLAQARKRGVTEDLWASATPGESAKQRLLQCERAVGYERNWGRWAPTSNDQPQVD